MTAGYTNAGTRPAGSFWREITVALVLSLAGAVLHPTATLLLGHNAGLRFTVVVLGAGYALALLGAIQPRIGRFVMLAAWAIATVALFVFDPSIAVWALVQVVAIWLVRCLYAHDGFVTALFDAALCAFAVAAGFATALHTHSVFLALWAFFLVQALFVLLPRPTAPAAEPPADTFDQAYRTAEAALARLHARR
ncbi:MAG TPA: hypothetical protein VFO79_09895 [Xanthomonadales bacterium]|nr:hypothetical protein [Xanthomonadales bacterium]